ncbi:MAG: nitrite reductase [Gammaproteobacteria bacterium]|jgi:hypothetical protein|nr:nitrite reductase [Gammaproteobacteria bacterium]
MNIRSLFATKTRRRVAIVLAVLLVPAVLYKVVYPVFFDLYTGVENAPLTYDTRELTEAEFEQLALELTEAKRRERAEAVVTEEDDSFAREVKIDILMNTPSFIEEGGYPHIEYFREAGIREYEGPKTCLECHATIDITHEDGTVETVDTLEDIVNTVHFKFQTAAGGAFSTYGYDGRQVNAEGARKIPVGKINRACGIPGSFSWTGWAALVASRPEHGLDEAAERSPVEADPATVEGISLALNDPGKTGHGDGEGLSDGVVLRSEGCGQCHIGGNYHPATEKMMPVGDVPKEAKEGIDCLICHAGEYDMNQRYVIQDKHGLRWNQDRSMRSALTVGRASNENCLNCHQHNMGGDAYIHNVAAKHLGDKHQRLLHTGAKRGNPFSPQSDAHAAAGIKCTDCHVPEGHKIPRGRKGVDLVASDLPHKEVSCESCHSQTPHNVSEHRALLNGHVARLACETCHIKDLVDNNVVLRDWVHPTWNAEEGIWEPTDVFRSGKPGEGLMYLWFNGNGTFLANALGSNPEGDGSYNPLMEQIARIDNPDVIAAVREKARELKKQYPDIDIDRYVETATDPLSQLSPEMLEKRRKMVADNLKAAMEEGESRIYPFKPFNAMMFEDMNNQGPFGAMILPFDYATYYETGDSRAAVVKAIQDPIVRRMYQEPFKLYMMDEFMAYFGVDGWKTIYPLTDDNKLAPQVEPHWMRQMGTLMVNHGIQREGHDCKACHQPDGLLDYEALGYTPERIAELTSNEIIDEIEP